MVCTLVQKYLPTCGDLSIVDISKALIQAACDLQEQFDILAAVVADIEAPYTTGCLTVAPGYSVTHRVLQATINKVCQLGVDLTALALDLQVNYSSNGAELDAYIANYLAMHSGGANAISNRMVPFSVIEYYGPLSNFSSTGVGLGDWVNIYLCNGLNGTPDKRGRVGVGVTVVPGGGAYTSQVDPALGNPSYTLNSPLGQNNITLTIPQLPSHAHPGSSATTIISPNPHTHVITPAITLVAGTSAAPTGTGTFISNPTSTGVTAENVTLTATTNIIIAAQGGGEAHPNYQPGLGCYYIQYRP